MAMINVQPIMSGTPAYDGFITYARGHANELDRDGGHYISELTRVPEDEQMMLFVARETDSEPLAVAGLWVARDGKKGRGMWCFTFRWARRYGNSPFMTALLARQVHLVDLTEVQEATAYLHAGVVIPLHRACGWRMGAAHGTNDRGQAWYQMRWTRPAE